ncbi:mRNA cleavage and polyadenylation specificity factor-like protein [Candidatus Nanohaloarchaea archaeon]|nr:mRNA cleavage and polyadenylation specificity factor-like protein [Candidatus Nanohaloarchaea archaeon]
MIREKDGIHFDLEDKVVADSRKARGDVNFVSHAHMDHVHRGENPVIASEVTRKLAEARTEKNIAAASSESFELIPSGHIIGSTAAKFGEEKEYLYTGDVSLRDRAYLEGFEPVSADVLVVESTYGIPAYRFPDQKGIESSIQDWVQDNDRPLFLFGYSLGKAQKIQHIMQEATERPIVAHGSVKNMNNVVEEVTDLNFRAKPYGENKELLEDNAIFIGPSSFARNDGLNKFVDKVDGLKAGFSGWAAQEAFKHRGGYDKTFPFSDHCDFDELVELVEKVGPEEVYTHHGFDEAFASYLKKEKGINARALKQNQSSLTDF